MSDAIENFFSLAHRLADCQNEHPDAAPLQAAYPDAEAPDAAHLAEPSPHKNLDPVTGNCLDCGCTREQIDDNLALVCNVVLGPNKIALLAIRRTIWSRERDIGFMEASLRCQEDCTARAANDLRAARHDLEQLKASFEQLRAAE